MWGAPEQINLSPSRIETLQLFIPSLALKAWRRAGLASLQDLTLNGALATFQYLAQKYDLTDAERFAYLQIKHLWPSLYTSGRFSLSALVHDLLCSSTKNKKKKGIAVFYSLLTESQTQRKNIPSRAK